NEEKLLCLIEDSGWLCPDCRHRSVRQVQSSYESNIHRRPSYLSLTLIHDFFSYMQHPIRQAKSVALSTIEEQTDLFQILVQLAAFHVPGMDKNLPKSLQFIPALQELQSFWQPPKDPSQWKSPDF